MAKNRKAAEAVVIKHIKMIDPSGKNAAVYEQMFSAMSDKQFDDFVNAVRSGEDYLSAIMENLGPITITVENNLDIAGKFGVEFFQQLYLTDPVTGATIRTTEKFLVYHLPVRRQIQTLEYKKSYPDDNKHIDDLTNQPSGPSAGSGISFPETLVLKSQGHLKGIYELMAIRGGNLKAMNEINRQIVETGGATQASVENLGTRAKAADTLSTYLTAMHFRNTI